MIAALYVISDGVYAGRPDVDCWPEERDARKYDGPWPVVAHPPCERWGRYWSGGPSEKTRRKLGDDNGCFRAALASVRQHGGVIEHPEASHAWRAHGLTPPRNRADGFLPATGSGSPAVWSRGTTATVRARRLGCMPFGASFRNLPGVRHLGASVSSRASTAQGRGHGLARTE